MVWASSANRRLVGADDVQILEVLFALEQPDRFGGDGHGPHRLLVPGMADVEDGVALATPHLELVVHLRHERAHGVHDGSAAGAGRLDHLGGRPMGAEHERGARGHLGDVVDENHALLAETVHDMPVVDDLVVAVDGGLEHPDHPGQRLDGLLDARTEAPRLGQLHSVDCGHEDQVTGGNLVRMSAPTVTSVAAASAAAQAGLAVGDEILSLNGHEPRDVIDFQRLSDVGDLSVLIRRAGVPLPRLVRVDKGDGEPLGVEVSSAVFDRVRTCDNHCAFCFIYQLPKGMRRSLYLKDDDYRLSFLYGNFTTLTRFTELDAERILTERLGPLFVSIHATDPELRAQMLRNPKGATSLRWLQVLLDGGIEVHGQIVVCPGVNDGASLEDTLAGILDRFPGLASVGAVPLGLSRYSNEPDMRPHTVEEATRVLDTIEEWQALFRRGVGRRMVFAADEYYLLAARDLPPARHYEGYPQHENGIGMARAFSESFLQPSRRGPGGVRHGFFASVDAAPAEGYRAPRLPSMPGGRDERPVSVLTGSYGSRVLGPLLAAHPRDDIELRSIPNTFFGGNIGVAGLLTGEDVGRVLRHVPDGSRCLLPDACLNEGRFLDGQTLADLPRPVEVVPSDGRSLRAALDGASFRPACAA